MCKNREGTIQSITDVSLRRTIVFGVRPVVPVICKKMSLFSFSSTFSNSRLPEQCNPDVDSASRYS